MFVIIAVASSAALTSLVVCMRVVLKACGANFMNQSLYITAVQDRGQQMRHVLKTWDLGRGSGV